MPHLSELHGAATHLAVVAIPLYVIVLLCRRAELGGDARVKAEPWVVAGAVAGTVHFWLGIAVTVIVLGVAGWRLRRVKQDRHTHGRTLLAGGVLALVAVLGQGYLGGRMTYHHGVGVDAGGQFAQTADGVRQLGLAMAKGTAPAVAGRQAFSRSGLGCASCHGDQAQGLRGPSLAGGVELTEFRHVHGKGLFPPKVVTDSDFAAINAWLRTLSGRRGRD